MARRSLAPTAEIFLLTEPGPDPLGSAQIDALDRDYGMALAGMARPITWGLQGSLETTDQSVWVDPQVFPGASVAAAVPVHMMEDGLPNTSAPSGSGSAAKNLLWGM